MAAAGAVARPQRRIALAKQHGYQGTPEQVEAKGREIRRAVKELPTEADQEQAAGLSRAQMDQLLAMTSAQRMTLGMTAEEIAAVERSLAADDAELAGLTRAPAPTSKPAAAAPAPTNLGMGADGVLRVSPEQLRDPLFSAASSGRAGFGQVRDRGRARLDCGDGVQRASGTPADGFPVPGSGLVFRQSGQGPGEGPRGSRLPWRVRAMRSQRSLPELPSRSPWPGRKSRGHAGRSTPFPAR